MTLGNRKSFRQRRGKASLEAVVATAAIVPIAASLFFGGVKICQYVYANIALTVAWPFI